MDDVRRWMIAALVAVASASAGVALASWFDPGPVPSPVARATVHVTTTPTPLAAPAPVASVASVGLDIGSLPLDEPGSLWVVVNKARPLKPQDYEPPDLEALRLPGNSAQMRTDAASAMRAMYAAAKADGAPFLISSAYRSYGEQRGLYAGYVATKGRATADRVSARPGYSEHQTGLAADLYDPAGCHLKTCYATTASGRWIAAHAADFGFVVRYPEGSEPMTGYAFEPWHVRYVGVDAARMMRDERIATLEELLGLPPAPDYD